MCLNDSCAKTLAVWIFVFFGSIYNSQLFLRFVNNELVILEEKFKVIFGAWKRKQLHKLHLGKEFVVRITTN